jgi:hypothetical protein
MYQGGGYIFSIPANTEITYCRSRESGNLEPAGEILLLFKQNVHQANLASISSTKYHSWEKLPAISSLFWNLLLSVGMETLHPPEADSGRGEFRHLYFEFI